MRFTSSKLLKIIQKSMRQRLKLTINPRIELFQGNSLMSCNTMSSQCYADYFCGGVTNVYGAGI
jgi:hypothetical protein